jgi:drug/metabolite transporter superfamily protein YnfA
MYDEVFWGYQGVKWLSGEKSNVWKTISVLVLRVLVWLGGFNGSFAWISVVFEQQIR